MVAISKQSDGVTPSKITIGGRHSIAASLQCVQPARKIFVRFLEEIDLKTEDVDGWRLVFTEAVVNAIKHGCNEDPENKVNLEWWAEEDGVVLAVSDPGTGPDEAIIAKPQLPDDIIADCGRGFFIISQLCDAHEHWRSPGGYRIVLRKNCACSVDRPVERETRPPERPEADSAGRMDELLLNDLSMSYECLAAFHRMGSVLISERGPSSFVREGLDSLALVYNGNAGLVRLCLSENVHHEIRDELSKLGEVLLPEEAPPRARAVLHDGESFFWESPSEVSDDSMLHSFQSGCCFPVVAAGKTLGCVVIGDRSRETPHRAEDFTNLRTFSDLIGIALANCNLQIQRGQELRAVKELEIAAEIQRNLLPILPPPKSEAWEITLRHESAQEVAGDYVEACLDSDGDLVLSVIDVMGKGVSAAMLATLFRTGLHTNLTRSQPLNELVQGINDVLCLQLGSVTRFITCAIVRIDLDSGLAEIVNAGHAPVTLMKDGAISAQVNPSSR